MLLLAGIGAVDDIRPLPASIRLAIQAGAVAAVVTTAQGRLLPDGLVWLEGPAALVAGLWFVNLVNFMDGLDWMTVAEFVPLTAFLAGLGIVADTRPNRRSSRAPCSAGFSASPRSTGPWRGCSWAMSARCPSA